MNRLFIHIMIAAFLFACSQQSESAASADESAPIEQKEEQQNLGGADDVMQEAEEILEWEDEESTISSIEKDQLEDAENSPVDELQKKKEDKFVKLFAKQKMEEFFDLWLIYANEEMDAGMAQIIEEELLNLIDPEVFDQLNMLTNGDGAKLKNTNFQDLVEGEAEHTAFFSFKLNGNKYNTQAKISSVPTEFGENWSFEIQVIE